MNKKIKIIELANNIANEKWDKVPKRISYMGKTYKFDRLTTKYFVNEDFESLVFKTDTLNNSVEILEDNTEEIEELDKNLKFDDLITPYGKNEDMMWTEIIKQHNKIDEIIRYIKRKDKNND